MCPASESSGSASDNTNPIHSIPRIILHIDVGQPTRSLTITDIEGFRTGHFMRRIVVQIPTTGFASLRESVATNALRKQERRHDEALPHSMRRALW